MRVADDRARAARSEMRWLPEALRLPDDATPFPWQEELFRRFKGGRIERSINIPTGLGKTAVMAIWLVAQAHGARLPRRLVYVVDRRAVVDQATEVARGLRDLVDRDSELRQALGLEARSLPISTLRGQHVDNKEWLEDPASLAIIVGTVDMIGSRLLFEGYGTSRKMRPYHAGLMGVDTLAVLDEAHLAPAFEMLLEAVAEGTATFGPHEEALRVLVPRFRLLALSATGRADSIGAFGLQAADLTDEVVRKRLSAPKRLTVRPLRDGTKLVDALARQAWQLTDNGQRSLRCIVFCDERRVATETKQAIEKLANGDKKHGIPDVEVGTELFVGGRRVFEREGAAKRLKELGFIAGSDGQRPRAAFLIATSAGEVGVDLDADHMVSDLVAWERMVQRLGRVNRRGDTDATVVVIEAKVEPSKKEQAGRKTVKTSEAEVERTRAVRKLIDRLSRNGGAADASPGALRELRAKAEADRELRAILDAATTPAPLRPALSRALVDAWSMTSLKEHTGRPKIDPWLRGWIKDEPPQTAVVWRKYLPVRVGGGETTNAEIEAFFEAAPPHASEVLETETFRVVEWLASRGKTLLARTNAQSSAVAEEGQTAVSAPLHGDHVVAVALTTAGDLCQVLRLSDIAAAGGEKEAKEMLQGRLASATLIIDARAAGLTDGLLDESADGLPRTADDGTPWMAEPSNSEPPVVRFRVRSVGATRSDGMDANWRERLRLAIESSEDGEPKRWLIVEKWRDDSATEDDRSAAHPQLLEDHRSWAEDRARGLARQLRLPEEYSEMLAIAAYLHDEGKSAERWQGAFNASSDGIYAKTRGPVNAALLDRCEARAARTVAGRSAGPCAASDRRPPRLRSPGDRNQRLRGRASVGPGGARESGRAALRAPAETLGPMGAGLVGGTPAGGGPAGLARQRRRGSGHAHGRHGVMVVASVPVDLSNPGQVFACLGFLEAADVLVGDAEGGFDWSQRAAVRFLLRAAGDEDPFAVVLRFLAEADIRRRAPIRYADPPPTAKKTPTEDEDGGDPEGDRDLAFSESFPSREADRMALPIRLEASGCSIDLGHWADGSSRNDFKLYSGNRTAASIARAMLRGTWDKPRKGQSVGRVKTHGVDALWRDQQDRLTAAPFDVLTPMGGSFNLDPRGGWTPLDAGYSPDQQKHGIEASPVVELLGAMGLEHARPDEYETRQVRYAVWSELVPPMMARPAVAGASVGIPVRRFRFRLDLSGKNKVVTFAEEEINV